MLKVLGSTINHQGEPYLFMADGFPTFQEALVAGSSSLAATPRQSSCHSVLCSHTYRPSLGASTGWGQEESQQISHERLLACPSQPGFHENTRHGRLCEFPLPVGQESHPPSAVGSSTAWPALTASRTQVCSHVQLGICILGFLLLLWVGHVEYYYFS